MSSPTFPLTTADTGYDKIWPASIVKCEIQKTGEGASQWSDVGDIVDAKLTAEAIKIKLSGRRFITKAFEIKGEIPVLASGLAMQTAMMAMCSNATDVRLTDRFNNVFSFTSPKVSVAPKFASEGDLDKNVGFVIELGGALTPTEFAAAIVMAG